jgi:hypothetical protein
MYKLLIAAALLLSMHAEGQDSVAVRYSRNITSANLSKYLHKLASDEFEGRETGKQGQKLAADYIASHFSNCGIPPLKASNSYFQQIPLLLKKNGASYIEIGGRKFEFMKDFYFFPGFDDTTLKLDSVTFIGYGIRESKYNEYEGLPVGEALLFLEGEPSDLQGNSLLTGTPSKSDWSSGSNRKKLFAVRDAAPSAVFIAVDSIDKRIAAYSHYIETPSMRLNTGKATFRQNYPSIFISREMADLLLSSSGKTCADLQRSISGSGKPLSVKAGAKVTTSIMRTSEEIFAQNVLGYVEGSDLKEEVIVLTAHYDHLGRDGDKIYYGADDDGSGTSAVMELAQAFARAKQEGHGPRRSMLFMAVAGEEKGLLGSDYYSGNPVFPLQNTVADLNIDMIGRVDEKHSNNPDYIYVIGSDKLSTELHRINENANTTYTKLELDYTYNDPKDQNRFYYRSDHYNFAKHNIPIIFYFNGVHADYHKHTDTVDKINFNKMEKITRLVFFTAWDLANRNERIKVDVVNDFKNDR